MSDPVSFLSYGGGVQSTAMILKCLDGSLERPDYIVFANTGSEMPYTYDVVQEVKQLVEAEGIPWVEVEHHTPLHEAYLESNGLPVIGVRSCTSKWKIEPINRFMRSIVGMGRRRILAQVWIGISTDESKRATPSTNQWVERRYPLLDLNMSRDDCSHFLKSHGMEVKKSGCFLCPYQSAHQWSKLRREYPDLFAVALAMETNAKEIRGFRGGLWGSRRSIIAFDSDVTLEDFGFDLEVQAEKCSTQGSCFL